MKRTLMKTTIAAVALFGLAGSAILVNAQATANMIENQIKTSKTGDHVTDVSQEVMFFSNYPQYNGNGFNLSTYNAASDYADVSGRNVGYAETSTYDDTGAAYASEIALMYEEGAKTIISSGFQVANTFMGADYGEMTFVDYDGIWGMADADGSVAGHEDEKIVLLDDNLLGTTYKNGASVEYRAEGAGYLAGIGAAAYTLADDTTEDKNIVMWGGINYPTVYSFMSGFAQGVAEVESESGKQITLWSGGDFSDTGISEANTYGTSSTEDAQTWYTGGFDGGTGTGSDAYDSKLAREKTKNAVAADASIIFPVAGGNTAVALNYLSSVGIENTNTRLIGVDTDNSYDYKDNTDIADFILFSATKSLELSGAIALAAIDDIDGDGVMNYVDTDFTPGSDYDATQFWAPEADIEAGYPAAQSVLAAEVAEWTTSAPADAKGLVMSGDLSNGGVGVTMSEYGTGATEFVDTVQNGLNSGLLESLISYIENAGSATIEAADESFTTATMPAAAPKDTNLTWLWIVLIIILVLAIVGFIASTIIKKSKVE